MIHIQFTDFQLSNDLLKAIGLLNFKTPTEVQQQVIPLILQNKDIIVSSETGSGKTASFAIPLCEKLDWEENQAQVLVITPTRELALQVKEDFFNIGRFKRIKVSAVFGQSPFRFQEKELKQKTHVVVGTPGRLIDHLKRGTLDLSQIKFLVIDEADEMLQMGFVDQVETLLRALPDDHLTVVLSATIPEDIRKLCEKYMRSPVHITLENQEKASDRIEQIRYDLNENQKNDLLKDLLILENPDSSIIFCNTQLKVEDVHDYLDELGYSCDRIHGGMEQSHRLEVMDGFKKAKFRYLVATDVAARGIDIDQISLVVNYDVPNTNEYYIHRIGRTGRIGNKGKAITFVTPSEKKSLAELHDYLGNEIELGEKPDSETISGLEAAFNDKSNTTPEAKDSKSLLLNESILKLHINAGKKTKMRAVDIVGTLCGIEGVEASDIGIINILDISTFVEILNNKGELVYRELQNRTIKGRMRRVSKADS